MACPLPLVPPAASCAKAFDENSVASARVVAKGRYFFDIVRISFSLLFGTKGLRGSTAATALVRFWQDRQSFEKLRGISGRLRPHAPWRGRCKRRSAR